MILLEREDAVGAVARERRLVAVSLEKIEEDVTVDRIVFDHEDLLHEASAARDGFKRAPSR